MSVINQMLRDIDARSHAAQAAGAAVGLDAPARKRTPGVLTIAILALLVLAGGTAGYGLLSRGVDQRSPPASQAVVSRLPAAVPVELEQPRPDPLPTAESYPARPEPAPVMTPALLPTAAPVAPQPTSPPVMPQEGRSFVMSSAFMPAPGVAPASRTVEPAVVKKVTETTPEAEAQQFHDDAQALRRAGKAAAAMDKYRLALERYPAMHTARVQLSRLLLESGQADAAVSLLVAGYGLQPDMGLAIAAGRLLADQGQREEALLWLERGRDGLRPADHALMGALLAQSGRQDAAIRAYQRALAADPHQGGWLLGLGVALESQGRTDEAQAAYRNALQWGDFKPEVLKFLRQRSGTPGS